jgi:hypothetical protein
MAWDGKERRDFETRKEDLVQAVVCAVRDEVALLSVSETVHRDHHAFITAWLDDQRMRKDRAEKIKTQVWGWFIISILGGAGTGAYKVFNFLREHLK